MLIRNSAVKNRTLGSRQATVPATGWLTQITSYKTVRGETARTYYPFLLIITSTKPAWSRSCCKQVHPSSPSIFQRTDCNRSLTSGRLGSWEASLNRKSIRLWRAGIVPGYARVYACASNWQARVSLRGLACTQCNVTKDNWITRSKASRLHVIP